MVEWGGTMPVAGLCAALQNMFYNGFSIYGTRKGPSHLG